MTGPTFALQDTFALAGEGWGITHNDEYFVVSDGTATLRFLDARSFQERQRIDVSDGGAAVTRLFDVSDIVALLEETEGKKAA